MVGGMTGPKDAAVRAGEEQIVAYLEHYRGEQEGEGWNPPSGEGEQRGPGSLVQQHGDLLQEGSAGGEDGREEEEIAIAVDTALALLYAAHSSPKLAEFLQMPTQKVAFLM